MRIAWLASIGALVGTIATGGCLLYSPGSFRDGGEPFVGKRVSSACLDLTATLTDDAHAQGSVISYSFGNRCWHEIHVDLSSIRATGRFADGSDRPLHAYDPHHELRSLQLDMWWMGHEEIEYLSDSGQTPVATCVDVGRVDHSAAPTSRVLCFGNWDLGAAEGAAQ